MRRMLIGALVAAVAVVVSASNMRPPATPVPLTLDETIALVAKMGYGETIPYMEATFTFDYEGRARHCEGNNNFHRVPPREMSQMYQWVAGEATRCYMARGGPRITENFVGVRRFGDSPWGFFSVPESRTVLKPCFEEAKNYYIEILRKLDAERVAGEGER